jgi:hypothetical protein
MVGEETPHRAAQLLLFLRKVEIHSTSSPASLVIA